MTTAPIDTRVIAGLCSFCPGKTPATMRARDRTGTDRLICADCDWIVTNLDWWAMHVKVMQYQMNGDTRPRWIPARLWRLKVDRLEAKAYSWTISFAALVGRGLTYTKEDHHD